MKSKDTHLKSLPTPSADTTGGHVVDELTLVIAEMKQSNDFIRTSTEELITLNRVVALQNRLLGAGALFGLIVAVGLGVSLQKQTELQLRLDQQLTNQVKTNAELAMVVSKLSDTYKKAEKVETAIRTQPKLSVRPADTADPTSTPVLVVEAPDPVPSPRPPRPSKSSTKKAPKAAVEWVPRKKKMK